ncbi:amidase family protein [Alicyclobacillus sp. SO9]|uniref:amidase family protein n=1 Tax=Alicyclobacillus sp. SO9 TaxID=2665646 RepID=UPI002104A0C6|nr:amidase family protein [Alicyclobacillus sp. SO9]
MSNTSGQVGTEKWLLHATIPELQEAMENGEITAVWIVTQFLRRIAKFNSQGPSINAVLELNPDALFTAEALDVERRASGARSSLHGIPILLKDNIDTGDKMHTSAGSIALAQSTAADDAFIVRKLREAGAVILGKANMTEWANFMTENMPNGYSSRGGQVHNPYGPGKLDTGGSSSGSAAGVAAGFAVAAIGTETSGSILSPASAQSLAGIKPTVGLVSRDGIIPIAYSQDTAGPIAKTVEDAAIVLSVIQGKDETDAATLVSEGALEDYSANLSNASLKGARIGIPRKFLDGVSEQQMEVFQRGISELKELGAETVAIEGQFEDYDESDIHVLIYEFKSALNAYLAGLSQQAEAHSLSELITFNLKHARKALKYEQTLLTTADRTSGTLTETRYLESRLMDIQSSREDGIDKVVKEYELDALLFINNYGAGIAAKAGYPSVTVPAGYTEHGEPIGLTFTGTAYAEGRLLQLAYAYERATQHRVHPDFD